MQRFHLKSSYSLMSGCLPGNNMNKAKPILVLCLVFIAGIAVGAIGTRIVVRQAIQRMARNPDLMRERIEREITSRLALSPDQQAKVHTILLRSQHDAQQLRREFQPQFAEIFDRTEHDVSEILTPDQRERFEKLLKEKRPLWRSAPLPR